MQSTIKKPLYVTLNMATAIYKVFTVETFFTATTVKRVSEQVSVTSHILSTEISYEEIEKIFEE